MVYKVLKIKGLIGYQDALDLQMQMFHLVQQRIFDGILLILEHKPVITMGIRTNQENLLVTNELLQERGVELYPTDRGGDITFHGPGQIVAYPILHFRDFGLRLSDYMHHLEAVIVDTLQQHNIVAETKDAFPGVWVNNTKICAIGVRAKQFITYHGLAFNVNTDKSYFNLINPCGITDYQVSTMADFVDAPNIEQLKDDVIHSFETVFQVSFEQTTLDKLKHHLQL